MCLEFRIHTFSQENEEARNVSGVVDGVETYVTTFSVTYVDPVLLHASIGRFERVPSTNNRCTLTVLI